MKKSYLYPRLLTSYVFGYNSKCHLQNKAAIRSGRTLGVDREWRIKERGRKSENVENIRTAINTNETWPKMSCINEF